MDLVTGKRVQPQDATPVQWASEEEKEYRYAVNPNRNLYAFTSFFCKPYRHAKLSLLSRPSSCCVVPFFLALYPNIKGRTSSCR